jgi:hypothetical protein
MRSYAMYCVTVFANRSTDRKRLKQYLTWYQSKSVKPIIIKNCQRYDRKVSFRLAIAKTRAITA